MLQLERYQKIKDYLIRNEYADIKKLAEMLNVSTATIRRALKQLESEKVVALTRGGATLAKKGTLYEFPYRVKQEMYNEEKRRISQAAMQYVHKNESIFLDSSSTVFEMTRFLAKFENITITTNDIYIAQHLVNAENIEVTVIGGSIRRHYYTLTGYFADTILKDLSFDCAFLGIDALSLRGGLMITNIEEVQIKRKVIDRSNKIIVLCDHSKFDQDSFLNVCYYPDIDMIITGRELDKNIYNKYIEEGVNLILV
ncbi:MAG: DeoR/GlpR family DNA-binding transcription regulator, partial [Treponema sp.]|nr:DeoR/GlpR family DNA-binding transcription regulator [Treponema sp.]